MGGLILRMIFLCASEAEAILRFHAWCAKGPLKGKGLLALRLCGRSCGCGDLVKWVDRLLVRHALAGLVSDHLEDVIVSGHYSLLSAMKASRVLAALPFAICSSASLIPSAMSCALPAT